MALTAPIRAPLTSARSNARADRYDNGFHTGNRCDISEKFYKATFGTLLALDVVVILLLLSKVERGRDKHASQMQPCVRLGIFSIFAQLLSLALGWDGMNAAAMSVLQVAVAAEFVKANWLLGVMLNPLQAVYSDASAIISWDATRRFAIKCTLVLHLGVMQPVIWAATRLIVQPAGWQGMHTTEWLNCLWMSFMVVELIVLLRLVRTVSKALVRTILESVADGPAHSSKSLESLAFRIKVMMYCYYVMLLCVILLMVVPMAFKLTFGFFPLTTLHYAVAVSAIPWLNVVLFAMARSRAASSKSKVYSHEKSTASSTLS